MTEKQLSTSEVAILIARTMFEQSMESGCELELDSANILAMQASIASIFLCFTVSNIAGGKENQKRFWDILKGKIDEELLSIVEAMKKDGIG